MIHQPWRLSYTSRRTFCSETGTAAEEVAAIQRNASEHNQRVGLMGALVASSSRFAQVLEGPRDVLERIFERICRDDRHDDVLVTSFAPIDTPAFADFQLITIAFDDAAAPEGDSSGEAMLAHLRAAMDRLDLVRP
jgi:hypothetical protein